MNDVLWHLDSAFLELVARPLCILGVIFAAMFTAAVILVMKSKGGSDDA